MDKIEISVDRVETNENINDCTCSICQNIFYKPVMCKNCENHFCTECIDEFLSKLRKKETKHYFKQYIRQTKNIMCV